MAYDRADLYARLGLAARTRRLQTDPELGSHRRNVEMIELMIRREGEESRPDPDAVHAAVTLLQKLDDPVAQQAAEKLQGPLNEEVRLKRIRSLMDEQRAHQVAQDRRELSLQTVLTVRQAQALFDRLQELIEKEEPDVRERLGRGLIQLIGSAAGPGSAADGGRGGGPESHVRGPEDPDQDTESGDFSA
jgi:hypothetical protein